MISVSQALSIIKSSIKPIKREYINVLEAKGRTLVSSIKSNTFSPPFNMSAMDGYAIKHKINGKSNKFKVVDEIFAGENKNNKILSGQAIRVFTGSRVPIGTNCVVMQENVSKIDKNHILINYNKLNEDYIRKKGQDFKKGSIVLKKNHQINARDIGLLISSGIKKVLVYKKPNIAVIATGNELVAIDKKIKGNQIFASSIYMIRELISLTNSNCLKLKIIRDDKKSIKETILSLTNIDLILTTGGVSVGKKDLVKESLASLGMITKFWKVQVRPGKPILFGLLKNIPVFGLPGNPVSSYVCFIIFVMVAINKLSPNTDKLIKKNKALALNKIINNSNRETYYRGLFFVKNKSTFVKIFKNQDSSLMKTLSLSNCLVKLSGKKSIEINKYVEILELSNGI